MDRTKAFEILCQHTASKNLINHGLAVEAVMRYYAEKHGVDIEYWGAVGLLHDVDYEKFPTEHLKHTSELLKPHGVSDDMIRSIITHGYGICSDAEPQSFMEKILFASDELTGLIIACALVNPDKKLSGVTVESVQKKWKKKDFAKGANRAVIEQGAEMLNMPLDELIKGTLTALQNVATSLGL